MEDFIGTIQAFAFNFAPQGWMLCQGQTLQIAPYQALFALLGTYYGGNGTTTFQLPDLRGRSLVGMGTGYGLSPIIIGQIGGSENGVAPHTHGLSNVKVATVVDTSTTGDLTNEVNLLSSASGMPTIYAEDGVADGSLKGVTSTISGATDSTAVTTKRDPYLGINYCICYSGIFPSRE